MCMDGKGGIWVGYDVDADVDGWTHTLYLVDEKCDAICS